MPATEAALQTANQVRFSGTIEPAAVSAAYRAGLVVTAVAMLLLPLLYVLLVGATGYAVWLHLTRNTWILERVSQWTLLAYVTPAVSGTVLVFFMVKPIFARPARRQDPLTLEPDAEPLLFATIDEICRQVRAPRPRRVDVNCTINASAGFMGHAANPFSSDLVLTIGLPLAAGLSVRQFAGVLAHEFGHFAQGGGMRLTGIVRGVNAWFSRVVYERDEWDAKLERWSKESSWQFQIVLYIARAAVWISRLVLKGLMHGGHAISCFMMRQMEYDADSYETRLAGTDAFVRTAGSLRELNAAARFAYNDLYSGYQGGALPQDLAGFIVERSRHLPPDLVAAVHQSGHGRTGTFDTHPCDGDRIQAAKALNAPGVIASGDGPATELFRDFDALSAAVSRHHFEHDLGLDVGTVAFVETAAAIRESRSRAEESEAIERVFDNCLSVWRPLRLPTNELEPLDESALHAELMAARAVMASAVETARPQFERFNSLEGRRGDAYAAQELFMAGFSTVKHEEFGLTAPTVGAAATAEQEAIELQQQLDSSLAGFEAAAGRRLACGALLSRRAVDGAADAIELVNVFHHLSTALPDLRELQRLGYAATTLGFNASGTEASEQIAARWSFLQEAMSSRCSRIQTMLADVPCPPSLTQTAMTLAERCGLSGSNRAEDPSDARSRTLKLYVEVLGRLCAITLQVEQVAVTT
jgi:Zn-dependent protease with chaperone function